MILLSGIENQIYNLPNQLSEDSSRSSNCKSTAGESSEIIFADEPTEIDSKTSDEVITLLKMTAKKYGQTIVMITHDDEITGR